MTLLGRIQAACDSGDEVALVLPVFGFVAGRIESAEDDVVTVATSDGARVSLHFTQVGFLLGK